MSYAVIWCEGNGPVRAGKLLLDGGCVVLEGADGRATVRRELPRHRVRSVRIGRTRSERLDGRPVVLVQIGAGAIRIASLAGAGELHEIAEHVGHRGVSAAPADEARGSRRLLG